MLAKRPKDTKADTGENKPKKPADHNRKRSNTLSALKRKNLKLADQMHSYLTHATLTEQQAMHMQRLRKYVRRCANLTLYRDDKGPTGMKLINSMFCGSKLCFVCNQNRQKSTRRKYWKWFEENQTIAEIENPETGSSKFVTRSQATGKKYSAWEFVQNYEYDIMHLTLTVPHIATHGFNGNPYFFDEIAAMFWLMRKSPVWNSLVFGGEYGIETTKSDNGPHIHIHTLLLVKREKQNRNKLHKFVLQAWNKASVNQYAKREIITDDMARSIMKGNRTIDMEFAKKLNPKGSTMINLETIYTVDRKDGSKVRSTEFNSKEMLMAVMEAISYHFEPQAFDKKEGEFDFELMAEIMPKIYRKALYKKFGCLHGEAALNVSHVGVEDTESEYAEVASMIDQDTGEVLSDPDFYICNPAFVFHLPEKDYKPQINIEGKKRMIHVKDAFTTREAIKQMVDIMKSELKRKQ